MAKKTELPAVAEESILLGPVQLPRTWLESFGPGESTEFTQAGVVLCSERIKRTIKIGDTPVVASISLYITREPVGNEESAAVAAVKDQRANERKAKDLEAAEQLAKEKRTMFTLGQQSSTEAVFGTLSQMDKLMALGDVVNRITSAKKA